MVIVNMGTHIGVSIINKQASANITENMLLLVYNETHSVTAIVFASSISSMVVKSVKTSRQLGVRSFVITSLLQCIVVNDVIMVMVIYNVPDNKSS